MHPDLGRFCPRVFTSHWAHEGHTGRELAQTSPARLFEVRLQNVVRRVEWRT